ncbi:Uncharacterised protein [Vibrio cholerae]|nr:Uncharacterised protein [Vibrio cholerae]
MVTSSTQSEIGVGIAHAESTNIIFTPINIIMKAKAGLR